MRLVVGCSALAFVYFEASALSDSGFSAGIPPRMGVWLGIGGFIGVGTLGLDAGVVATSKIVTSCLIAAIYLVLREGKGDAGAGLRKATVSSRAAAVAVSTYDVSSMRLRTEKLN